MGRPGNPGYDEAMKRKGKALKVLPDGAPRRMADGKNAWRKMSLVQRFDFLDWIGVDPDMERFERADWLAGIAARWEEKK